MGVSLSEADIWDADYEDVFWGREIIQKLKSIKKRYDPENILTNWGAVGFDMRHERFKCYPKQGDW